MSEPFTSRQVGAFVRSLLPSQAGQFLLLLGSFLLFIAPHARWLPQTFDGAGYAERYSWELLARGLALPLVFAGAAGWYAALVGFRRSERGLLLWVIVPATATILGIALLSIYQIWLPLTPSLGSVIETILSPPQTLKDFFHVFVAMGFGIRLAVLGLAFVLFAFVLLLRRQFNLPVRIGREAEGSNSPLCSVEEIEYQRRVMRFVWMMVALPILTSLADSAFGYLLIAIRPHAVGSHSLKLFWEQRLWGDLTLLLLVLLAIDKESRNQIWNYFRLPRANYILLGIVMPAAVACLWPAVDYLHHQILWAHGFRGTFLPPSLAGYFDIPAFTSLVLLPAALVEEIAWRGYLQPRFIRRYGLIRGIVLVGVVWGAFHFYYDFNGAYSLRWVAESAAIRIAATVSLSFPLAWLTMRSKSILPAALFHAVHNAGLHVPRETFPGFGWALDLAYLFVGYLLFRHFPITSQRTAQETEQQASETPPEPATSEL